jgi:hypothetical protein
MSDEFEEDIKELGINNAVKDAGSRDLAIVGCGK